MKKVLTFLLCSLYFVSIPAISTEEPLTLSQNRRYALTQTVVDKEMYFDAIPERPTTKIEISSFQDEALTITGETLVPNTLLSIISLTINSNGIPVFTLSNGQFIKASREAIFNDLVSKQQSVSLDYWLKPSFVTYEAPYTNGVSEVKNNLKPYSRVHLVEQAETEHGIYYKTDSGFWISVEDLSVADNRMAKVQEVLLEKYNKDKYGIYIKQLNTQTVAGINIDRSMYSASIAKLATLYASQEQVKLGKLSLDSKFEYKDNVNQFPNSYDPSGSGKLEKKADHKLYTVKELLEATAKESDNVATNMLGYYVNNQYDSMFQTQVDTISGMHWDMKKRQISPQAAGKMMEAIYYQNGDIVNYLSKTDFDNTRIPKNIPVKVAHKIGDAYDYKHDAAIVYAEQPFIMIIFTDKSSYDDITKIADDVFQVLK